MTTLTTMIVVVRLAFYPETGMDAYSPIATVILGGLTVSTLLTLIVIPVVYTFVDDIMTGLKKLGKPSRSKKDEQILENRYSSKK